MGLQYIKQQCKATAYPFNLPIGYFDQNTFFIVFVTETSFNMYYHQKSAFK